MPKTIPALLSIIITMLLFSCAEKGSSRQRTDHWQLRNQQFNTALDSLDTGGVVFLGNSIIEGFDLGRWFPEKQFINRGIAGDHLDGLLERLNNSAVGLEPQKLFIMIGINDIGDGREDQYLKTMYTRLIDTLTEKLPDTAFFLHSILPTSARWKNCPPDQIRSMNVFLAEMSEAKDLAFIDLHPLFLDGEDYLNPAFTPDGLHLNDAGYEVWVEQIRRFVND